MHFSQSDEAGPSEAQGGKPRKLEFILGLLACEEGQSRQGLVFRRGVGWNVPLSRTRYQCKACSI